MAQVAPGLNQTTVVARSKSAKSLLKRIFGIFSLDGNSWFHCEVPRDLTVKQVRSTSTEILQLFSLTPGFVSPPDEFF